MGTFYTIEFEPEESQKWMSYEDNKELAVKESVQYVLFSEEIDGRTSYYIINENGEKVYNIWQKARGDLVTLS